MDVKDIRGGETNPQSLTNLQKPVKALNSSKVEVSAQDSVDKTVQSTNTSNAEIREKLNSAINVVNLAMEATSEIDNLVKSIGGIVDQAKSESLTPSRRAVLEKEAKELVQEIKRKAEVSSSDGVKPLAGDKIRLEVEEKIGRTLDFVLPDLAKDGFGLGEIGFSRKEAIIQTVTNVEKARKNIQEIKKAVDETMDAVKSTVGTVEVALQNTEASEASIRDLDQAVKLARDTKLGIKSNPVGAMGSLGKLDPKALELLK